MPICKSCGCFFEGTNWKTICIRCFKVKKHQEKREMKIKKRQELEAAKEQWAKEFNKTEFEISDKFLDMPAQFRTSDKLSIYNPQNWRKKTAKTKGEPHLSRGNGGHQEEQKIIPDLLTNATNSGIFASVNTSPDK